MLYFRYLNTYKKYSDLLNNNADQDVSAFLRETHSIDAFKKVTPSFPPSPQHSEGIYKNLNTVYFNFQIPTASYIHTCM